MESPLQLTWASAVVLSFRITFLKRIMAAQVHMELSILFASPPLPTSDALPGRGLPPPDLGHIGGPSP